VDHHCDHPADGLGIDFGFFAYMHSFKAPGILDALERRVVLAGLALLESRARALIAVAPWQSAVNQWLLAAAALLFFSTAASIYGSAALGPPATNRGRPVSSCSGHRLLSS